MKINNTIVTIAKKELQVAFNNPASYIITVVFLLLWQFLFFLNAFLVGEASLRGLFDWLPWLMLVLVPALTMGSIAQEKSEGTLEVVLTHPVRDLEFVIGKFIGSWIFVSILLFFTIPLAASFSLFGSVDIGIYVAQVVASSLMAGALVALGIYISSRSPSQIAALLVSVVACFGFIIMGSEFITVNFPLIFVSLLERISILTHFQAMTKGVVDLRDIWYFGTFVIVFLLLAYLSLRERKFGNRKDLYKSHKTGIWLCVGIAILTNAIGSRIPGRIDLTADKAFTLSASTKNIAAKLPDIVTITLYVSSKLPAQYSPVSRSVKDLLRDYQTSSRGNISVITKDPSENPQVSQEAQSRGVQEIKFNVVSREEFQIKTGYLGLAVTYADKHEAIPFIDESALPSLEYQITSIIRKLTNKDKKTVAFLSGAGEKSPFSEYQAFNTELSKLFDVTTAQISTQSPEIATETSTLVLAGPTSKLDAETLKAVNNFMKSGKSALLLLDSFAVSPQSMSLTPTPVTDNAEILNNIGVSVNKDIVYDLRSHETVRLGSGAISYLLPYPFWVGAVPGKEANNIIGNTQVVVMPWSSSIIYDDAKQKENGYTATKLLNTTFSAGSETKAVDLSPETYHFTETGLSEKLLAVALDPIPQSTTSQKGRIVIVGDSDFLTDQYMQSSDNINFGLQVVSWLVGDDALKGIKLREGSLHKLVFKNATEVSLIKYGNMLLVLLVPIALGFLRLKRRRELKTHTYQSI